ncbi:MAG: hypothetical protein WC479_12780 [Candidatus Izemoplasmatales bacterium]
MDDTMSKIDELNKKMDKIMKHLGCESTPEEDYDKMSEEEKNAYDEKQVMSRDKKSKEDDTEE